MMKSKQAPTNKQITACTMDCPDACSLIVSSDEDGGASLKGNPENNSVSRMYPPRMKKKLLAAGALDVLEGK